MSAAEEHLPAQGGPTSLHGQALAEIQRLRADLAEAKAEVERLLHVCSELDNAADEYDHRLRAVQRAARKGHYQFIPEGGTDYPARWLVKDRVLLACPLCFRALPADGVCKRVDCVKEEPCES